MTAAGADQIKRLNERPDRLKDKLSDAFTTDEEFSVKRQILAQIRDVEKELVEIKVKQSGTSGENGGVSVS